MTRIIKKIIPAVLPFLSVLLFTSEQFSDDGRAGYTGSPGETDCTTCHSSFPVNTGGGTITFQNAGMPLNEYVAGQTYNMSITVSRTSNNLFGFGFEALNSLNDNAGTLVITDAAATQIKTRVVNSVTRRNVVHQLNAGAASGSKTFNFSWTAPSSGTGPVSFYFAGVAADGNANDNNDYVYKSSLTVTEQVCPVPDQPNPISGNPAICHGTTQTYTINPVIGATSYSWTIPAGWTGSSSANSITVMANSNSGNLQVVANNGCGSSLPVSLFVNVSNLNADAGTDLVICEGESISLGGNPSASGGTTPYTYTWTPALPLSDPLIANPLATINSTTGFTLLVTDSNGCSDSDDINIDILPSPSISISLLNDSIFASTAGNIQWFLNSVLLTNDTLSYLVPQSSGNYQAKIVYQNGCISSSNILAFSLVEIPEGPSKLSFKLFPIPVNDNLHIQLSDNHQPTPFKILKTDGSSVHTGLLANDLNTIDISQFAEGIYILVVESNFSLSHQKFTIIR